VRAADIVMRSSDPVRIPSLDRTEPASLRWLGLARAAGLGALLWGVTQQVHPKDAGGRVAVTLLMAAAAAGWMAGGLGWSGWLSGRDTALWHRPRRVALVVLALAGGGLAALAPIAITFPAVAALGAGIGLEASEAVAVTAVGVSSVLVAGVVSGAPAGFMVSGGVSSIAGLMAGRTRRQYTERARQAESLLEERLRADAERDRAAALTERNRIAREIHDVLAHSLGALAVHLDAADAVLEQDGDSEQARQLVRQARSLAVTGLAETRQAVHALREEPVALAEQLGSLVAHDGATLSVTGVPRSLDAGVGVALYRAAQEAITNARKHAPGAPISVHLDFGARATAVTVSNGAPTTFGKPGPLARSGAGFGLTGMRERIELLGGSVSAEPDGAGFTVRATVPA
jgi:signal transduction histidine kinase